MREKGITLIALVVTIIVLLILAGVSIATLTGNNGILNQAQRAKEETEIATEEEQRKLAMAEAAMNFEETEYQGVTIPAGFAPTRIEGESKVEEGLVIIDSKGNEFVWIPVGSEDLYKRNDAYVFVDASKNAVDDTNYLPDDLKSKVTDEKKEVDIEKETVSKAGGFYISRYEAGKEENDGSPILVSKKGATVWNNISQVNCKSEAKKFINNSEVKSGLITGIQWDVVMSFVNGKKDGKGNEFNVAEYRIERHTGEVAKSGQNDADKVCNVYDLEGNPREYIAELDSRELQSSTGVFHRRGGNYDRSEQGLFPASCRGCSQGMEGSDKTFRFVLYLIK